MRPIRSLLIFLCAAPLAAQSTLVSDASVRAKPSGVVIARLKKGTAVMVGPARSGKVYVTFTGWVEGSYVGPARDSFPAHLTGKVSRPIRSAPSLQGAVLGNVRPLAGLFTTRRQASWVNIHRGGWVDAKALKSTAAPVSRAPARTVAPPALEPTRTAETVPKTEPRTASLLRVARTTVARDGPNGLIVGQVGAGSYVEPLARSRGWVRVRTEVWVPERDVVPADSSYTATLSAADLRADPEGTRGKTVRWEVQVLALQFADPLRRDLARDEPYFLAKGPGAEDQLLYLAIPPSLLAEARATPALTPLLVTARVRTGRSQPVGIPILDILSFARQ